MEIEKYQEFKETLINLNLNDFIYDSNNEIGLNPQIKIRVNGEGYYWSPLNSFKTEFFFEEFELDYNVNNDNDLASETLEDVNYFDIYIEFSEDIFTSSYGGWVIMEENELLCIPS